MGTNVEKMLSIHLTDLCNNKCIFCIVDSPAKKENKVTKDRVFSFLEEYRDQGYVAVNLHGGESTTRPDFFEILQKIKDCGYLKVILQTNGRKISKMEYAEKVVGLGVTKFVVSIHGSSPEIHDNITQTPGSLKHAVKGIKNMKTLGIHVRTNSVMSKLNDKDFPAIMKLLLKLNIDHINISGIHTAGAAFKNFHQVVPKYVDIFPYLEEAVDIVTAAGVTLTLEGFPFCMIPNMEKYVIPWENQKFKMLFRDIVLDDYESYMDKSMRIQGEPCINCHQKAVCGGVYKEYIAELGWGEFINIAAKRGARCD
ncbi:MAG: radical SAM protein [Acidobacteria bacterium]|jgi:MoaA/NifB/PqqE/SkfB family radical SAM enzyme|nr:radical SAM protein [Acidobacteriota bacterium]